MHPDAVAPGSLDPSSRIDSLPLSTLDTIALLAGPATQPIDFCIAHWLCGPLDTLALKAGFQSACHRFPIAAARVRRGHWAWASHLDDAASGQAFRAVAEAALSPIDVGQRIASFLEEPFDPACDAPVRQLALVEGQSRNGVLITRFHHAACDGTSAFQWLAHQLEVAWGHADSISESAPPPRILLRRPRLVDPRQWLVPEPPCDPVWTRNGRSRGRRGWHTFSTPLPSSAAAASRNVEDWLAAAFLWSLLRWNRRMGGGEDRLGLWIPVNIRKPRDQGFGNGTSRIRVYLRPKSVDGLSEIYAHIRKNKAVSLRRGEWAVPSHAPTWGLPLPLGRALVRSYVRRPWIDVASAPFTYIAHTELDRLPDPARARITRIENIYRLLARHAVGLICFRLDGAIWSTLTHDPDRLTADDARAIGDLFLEGVVEAVRVGGVERELAGGDRDCP